MRSDGDCVKESEAGPGNGPAHSSFGEFLAELRSLFPPALLDGTGWERLLALAHRLPIHVIDNRFGFEFALCDPEPAADFFAGFSARDRLAEFYVSQGKTAPPGSAPAAMGAFLVEQAQNPQAFLPRSGGDVILEYDLVGATPDPDAPPGIFLVPGTARETSARELLGDPDSVVTALWAVAGRGPDSAEQRQVQRIYETLPPTGFISQAGVIPGRAQRAIRLVVRIHSVGEAIEMLERLQWPGSSPAAAAVLEDVMHLTRPYTGLSMDVTAQGVSPRLGLELFRPVEWYELDRPGWKSLFDLLVEKGWCLPEKGRGMAAWPQLDQVFAEGGVYRVRQTINHVKLVMDRVEITAKAYAGIDMPRVVL